jgi:GPH family glycoside/pentoside/hexuronide:cation symporter
MSMTADVIDLDELNHGVRREGVFGAIYWYMVKFGFAIAGGLSGVILSVVGFDGNASVQPEGAIDGLRLAFSGIPMLGTLIAMYIMHNYSIDEKRANEIRTELDKRAVKPIKSSSSYSPKNSLQTLFARDFDLDLEVETDFSSKSESERKSTFTTSLNSGTHGFCFSPYLEGQDIGDTLSEAQIRQRMDIINPYTKWVRSFSCTNGNEHIPKVAHQQGLKTMVGAWIGSDKEQNEKEINALINLAKSGYVDIASVGNEVLLRGELSKTELIGYINRVKEALPGIQVGCVDTYYQFSDHPELVDACDIILANCYPFWEGCNINEASIYLQKMYAVTQEVAKGKPVLITETGWPNNGDSTGGATPSMNNAMQYFTNVNNWSQKHGIDLFYFSSFDESWKVHHEGDVGQSWGIWDASEKNKYIQDKVTTH